MIFIYIYIVYIEGYDVIYDVDMGIQCYRDIEGSDSSLGSNVV